MKELAITFIIIYMYDNGYCLFYNILLNMSYVCQKSPLPDDNIFFCDILQVQKLIKSIETKNPHSCRCGGSAFSLTIS